MTTGIQVIALKTNNSNFSEKGTRGAFFHRVYDQSSGSCFFGYYKGCLIYSFGFDELEAPESFLPDGGLLLLLDFILDQKLIN